MSHVEGSPSPSESQRDRTDGNNGTPNTVGGSNQQNSSSNVGGENVRNQTNSSGQNRAESVVEQCEKKVEEYRRGHASFEDAYSTIHTLLLESEQPSEQIIVGLRRFASRLENFRSLTRTAHARGQAQEIRGAEGATGQDRATAPRPTPEHPAGERDSDVEQQREFQGNERDDINQPSQRRAYRDDESDSDASQLERRSPILGKRVRGDLSSEEREHRYPWLSNDNRQLEHLHPNILRARELIDGWSADPKEAWRQLRHSLLKPEFPSDQWKKLLAGEAVDLDKVFTSINSRPLDNKYKQTIGDKMVLEIVGEARATKRVESHADWISSWTRTRSAMLFLFDFRRDELEQYTDHVEGLFRSISPEAHRAVIHADQAIREHIARLGSVSFADLHAFYNIERSYLSANGAEYRAAVGTASSSYRGLGSQQPSRRPAVRSADPCNNWNDGKCIKSHRECRYRHVCKACKQAGHTYRDSECTKKGERA